MHKPLSELKNAHRGADIWVIASGKSLDYVDPTFFCGKLTLGINHVFSRFQATYLLVHNHAFYADCYRAAATMRAKLLTVEQGFVGPKERQPMRKPGGSPDAAVYRFECDYPAHLGGLDLDVVGTDALVAGMSTLHTALHAAAYLGAANIIVCGADGGLLDGEKYFEGYRDGRSPLISNYRDWLGDVEQQTLALRARLRAVYGCQIVSLNPFINFALEGHRYEHA